MSIQYTATDFLNTLSGNGYSYTKSYKKKVLESDTNVETLQEDVAELKKTIKNLKRYSEDDTPETKLEKQLSSLVESYNSTLIDADDVSNDELEKQLDKLKTLVSDNEKLLKKVGITISDDGLTFDSETFEDADNKTINKLFDGKESFVNQADKLMRKIEKYTDKAQYSVVEHSFGSTVQYGTDDIMLAASFMNAKEVVRLLGTLGELMENGTLSDEYEGEVDDYLSRLASLYNSSSTGEYENFSELQSLYDNNKEALSTIGYTFSEESDGILMTYGGSASFDSTEFVDAYLSLFGSDSEFINSIMEYCDDGFNSVLKTASLDISIVDEYV
ncbi:MAG: hypothetical protein LUH10_03785 [Tannerellaceae bacterium]|nr:hypothetical protein [Tannerellaceae bacterium]